MTLHKFLLTTRAYTDYHACLSIPPTSHSYYGGKGLPFFWTKFDGAATANGEVAKQAFSIHKTMGTYGKYLIPLHMGAAGAHMARGQAIFSRINPFR
jgi:cytochrome b561